VTPETATWQSICKRYELQIDEAIEACRDDTGAPFITVVIAPDQWLKAGPRRDMDGELREYGHEKLADYINASDDVPDGRVVGAIAHVVVLAPDDSMPIIGTMPVYVVTQYGGSA
jgi:hypothetical protein